METQGKIYVAGHRGMVGSAIVRALEKNGYLNIVVRTHEELRQRLAELWQMRKHRQILCMKI